jgi:hypothetical protein
LFTLHPTPHAAEEFAAYFGRWPGADGYEVAIAAANHGGATITNS